jgi:hypothetical protein
VKQARAIETVAVAGWDPAALRREQLNYQGIGLILEDIKAAEHPEWKDIADRSGGTAPRMKKNRRS